ncbi:hypothetical protein [Clostridium botulinum]|nr:hypothetical protein [Clostridium botulinum]
MEVQSEQGISKCLVVNRKDRVADRMGWGGFSFAELYQKIKYYYK